MDGHNQAYLGIDRSRNRTSISLSVMSLATAQLYCLKFESCVQGDSNVRDNTGKSLLRSAGKYLTRPVQGVNLGIEYSYINTDSTIDTNKVMNP